jgi:hypothetical protein
MRSTMAAIPFLAACTSGEDSNAFICNDECADYYTIRAIDSVHAKVWSSVLANQPPGKDGTIPYDNLQIPCIAGSLTVNGTAIPSTTGAVEVDLSVVHQGCQQSDPKQAEGYTITTTGTIVWKGEFSEGGARDLAYQSPELSVSGTVVEATTDPVDIDETCTLKVTLTSTSNDEFKFAGAWCGRPIVVPET